MTSAAIENEDWNALDLVGLPALMRRTSGHSNVMVGILDGPVVIGSAASAARDSGNAIAGADRYAGEGRAASKHGAFVAGMLFAEKSSPNPGICPGCTLFSRPIFQDSFGRNHEDQQVATPEDLARGLLECLDAGALVVNLSAALIGCSADATRSIGSALDRAMSQGMLVVAAAGNQAAIDSSVITSHPWVITVVACGPTGEPMRSSNLSHSIGRNGLRAPGVRIVGTGPVGERLVWNGTSVAAPFVTGTVALLCSEFPKVPPRVIRFAVMQSIPRPRRIVPPVLDAKAAWAWLNSYSGR